MTEGHVGSLTEEQKRKLGEFRSAVQDVLEPHHDDCFLLRWLRARKFNVKAAENMLRKSLAWRKSLGMDEIFESWKRPEVLVKYTPGGIAGHDREGYPVWIFKHASIDLHGMIRTCKKIDIVKNFAYCFEVVNQDFRKQSKKLGKVIDSMILVQDFEDIQFSQYAWKPAFDVLSECLKVMEANYPETLKKCLLINTPSWFNYVYTNLVTPFISEETAKKVLIFSNSEEWKQELLKDIDASDLPQHYGGTKVDPDGNPKCPSLILPGGKIPLSYVVNAKEYFLQYPTSKRVSINRHSSLCVDVKVEKSGSMISWEFMTDCYDIGFGVFLQQESKRKDSDKKSSKYEEIPIISIQRINCDVVPEEGLLECEKPGTYVMKFDNSYSWIHKKTLFYNILVTPPLSENGIGCALN